MSESLQEIRRNYEKLAQQYPIAQLVASIPVAQLLELFDRIEGIERERDHVAAQIVADRASCEALRAAIAHHVCGYCENRVGFNPDPKKSPYPPPCKQGGCADLRDTLAATAPRPAVQVICNHCEAPITEDYIETIEGWGTGTYHNVCVPTTSSLMRTVLKDTRP